VLLFVVAGHGVLGVGTTDETEPLTDGTLLGLPHGATLSITAGDTGLCYLTAHRHPRYADPPLPGTVGQ